MYFNFFFVRGKPYLFQENQTYDSRSLTYFRFCHKISDKLVQYCKRKSAENINSGYDHVTQQSYALKFWRVEYFSNFTITMGFVIYLSPFFLQILLLHLCFIKRKRGSTKFIFPMITWFLPHGLKSEIAYSS